MAPDYRVMNRLRRAITIVCEPMRKGPFYIWRYLGVVTALSLAIAVFDRVAAAASPDTPAVAAKPAVKSLRREILLMCSPGAK